MIDVIIPVYKAEKTLIRTLSSILEQTIVDKVKVIIVVDGDDYYDTLYITHFVLLNVYHD